MRIQGLGGATIVAIVAVCTMMGGSAAAQRPTPLPTNASATTATTATTRLPVLRYPMSATNFHKYVDYFAGVGAKLVASGAVPAGDVNGWMLMVKDCAGQAEADGVVTRWEGDRCWGVMKNIPLPKAAQGTRH